MTTRRKRARPRRDSGTQQRKLSSEATKVATECTGTAVADPFTPEEFQQIVEFFRILDRWDRERCDKGE